MKSGARELSRWIEELGEGALVLAGVSGGADSVYLAHHLKETLVPRGHRVELVHVNHGLRGEESDADEDFVRALAKRLSLPCHSQRIDPESILYGGGRELPDESRLRDARLGLIRALASALGAKAIALGHQRDDLAETFLLMALRGSGPIGLSGMTECRRIPGTDLLLVRPLLSITRAEIVDSLTQRGEAWREDSTNADPRYRRNRVRSEVLPLLSAIEPGAVGNLAESAQFCGEVAEFYIARSEFHAGLATLAATDQARLVCLGRLRGSVPRELEAGVLRFFWHSVNSGESQPRPPSRTLLSQMTQRLRATTDTAKFEGAGVRAIFTNHYALFHHETLPIEKALQEVASGFPFPLVLGEDELPTLDGASGGFSVSSRVPDIDAIRASAATEAWIDAVGISGELWFRIPDADERVQIAPKQYKTWRRILQEAHVPEYAAANVPALVDGKGVLWIPGIRRAHRAFVDANTSECLHIRYTGR